MTEDIFEYININAKIILESDIDSISEEIIKQLSSKIDKMAYNVYADGDGLSDVARRAFIEKARDTVKTGLYNYLFKNKYWKDDGREILPYIYVALNGLVFNIKKEFSCSKQNVPVCLICRLNGIKEYMVPEGKLWRCNTCFEEYGRLLDSNCEDKNKIEFYRLLSIHSRTGYKCPECERFIPNNSSNGKIGGKFGISCPYIDCNFFGTKDSMEKMSHPMSIGNNPIMSVYITDKNNYKDDKNIIDSIDSKLVTPEDELLFIENMKREFDIIKEVIDAQIESVKRTNSPATIKQKLSMYEAYKNMLNKFPEEMVSYLAHLQQQNSDFPIQARVFQEYASIIQDEIPITIYKGNEEHDIISLTDPELQLFTGISIFDAIIDEKFTIPNNTQESYTGGRKFKFYGPCFIGMIIDIIDKNTNESLKNEIEYYGFAKIKMKQTVKPNTEVTVKHFRIPSHYEMGSLVYLQRIRKKIVDSVYFKLNGKKR